MSNNITHNTNTVSPNSLGQIDKDTLIKAIKAIDGHLTEIANERQNIKDLIDSAADQINLDKKIIRKMARTYYNASFKSDSEETEVFETFYAALFPTS
jgi:hypothetical protein